jgi:hypothetical protein
MTKPTLHVARTSDGLEHVNTLDLRLEDRHVFLIEGIEFHNDQLPKVLRVPETLVKPSSSFGTVRSKKALKVQVTDANNWQYESREQGVRYIFKRTHTRTELKQALETEDAHVIYSGHARFGRGPCFGRGTGTSKGEEWEDGKGPDTGILRMGMPFLSIPISDILHHGYTANLVPSDVTITASDCDADLRPHVSKLKPHKPAQIHPKLLPQLKNPDPDQTYWAFSGSDEGQATKFVVLFAGFEETTTAPLDLGATDMKARLFGHFGCSTLKHNRDVVVALKGYELEDDQRYSIFTTDLSNGTEVVLYFYHLLSCPEPSRGGAWKASVEYAIQKTNSDLGANGERHRLK